LDHADIPEESKHPVILPRKSHVWTKLIIRYTHEQLGHAGRGHVLAKLRERYWITKANSAVRQLISSCVTCRRIKSTPLDQKMADLPEDRLTPAPPFTYVGVDTLLGVSTKRRSKTEDRRPKIEDRRSKTEDRRPKIEDRRPKNEDRKTKSSYNFKPFKLKAVIIIDNQA